LYNHNQPQQQSAVATEPPTTMTTTTVWVQLYYAGMEESVGNPTRVNVAADNAIVDDLVNAVKEKCSNTLSHCDAAELTVYTPSTTIAIIQEGNTHSISPGGEVPKGTTVENPVIVVAPQKQQQQVSFVVLLDLVSCLFSFCQFNLNLTLSWRSNSNYCHQNIQKERFFEFQW
jgi:hypothetical protein